MFQKELNPTKSTLHHTVQSIYQKNTEKMNYIISLTFCNQFSYLVQSFYKFPASEM